MRIQDLLEKFRDIKTLAEDIKIDNPDMNEDIQNRIIAICEDVEVQHKIEERLGNE